MDFYQMVVAQVALAALSDILPVSFYPVEGIARVDAPARHANKGGRGQRPDGI